MVGIAVCERRILHTLICELSSFLPDTCVDLRFSNRHLVLHLVQTADRSWSNHTRISSGYTRLYHSGFRSDRRWYCDPDDIDSAQLLLHSCSCKEVATRRCNRLNEDTSDCLNVPRQRHASQVLHVRSKSIASVIFYLPTVKSYIEIKHIELIKCSPIAKSTNMSKTTLLRKKSLVKTLSYFVLRPIRV